MAPWPCDGGLCFTVYVDGVRVTAHATAATLQLHFDAPNPGDAALARAFYAHIERLQVEAVARYRLHPNAERKVHVTGLPMT
ncbi:MAG: DUF1488 family protein [Comamonadaceae bacterium]|nr:MAG: DUF1488 family protein [Comamonadaceae bacterium]